MAPCPALAVLEDLRYPALFVRELHQAVHLDGANPHADSIRFVTRRPKDQLIQLRHPTSRVSPTTRWVKAGPSRWWSNTCGSEKRAPIPGR